MRRKARIDGNHTDIVAAFRILGASVVSLAGLAHGVPDLLVAYRDKSFLVEIKNGAKSPSRRRLTTDQTDFRSTWKAPVFLVENVRDVAAVLAIHV